jgi:hypothetical protein
MDKTQDLILGVLGTQWERSRPHGVTCYLESIKRSGFCGRKVMLVWDIHPYTKNLLIEYGFEVVNLPTPSEPFFHARMHVCADYLKEHYTEFRYVFFLDVKDLVLQSDPSLWMEQNIGDKTLIGSTECVTIGQEETNLLWRKSVLGEKYTWLDNHEVINGGTWAGKGEPMKDVFAEVYNLLKDYGGPYPPCQISINAVLRTEPFFSMLKIPRWSEGFAACLHPCWSPWRFQCWPNLRDAHPVLDINKCTLHAGTTPNPNSKMIVFNPTWGDLSNRLVRIVAPPSPLQGLECVENPEGKLFSIVHGYDRDWDVKLLFEYKYRMGKDFNIEAFVKDNQEWIKAQPAKRRGLRTPRRLHSEMFNGNSKLPQSGRVFRRNT